MWRDHALPRLRARGLGADRAAETLRLTGIGESAVVDLIGEDDPARPTQPQVATYARLDAVDLRVSAVGEPGRPARRIVDETVATAHAARRDLPLRARRRRLARGARASGSAGRRLATVEVGTAGQLGALLGTAPWLVAPSSRPGRRHEGLDLAEPGDAPCGRGRAPTSGLAVRARASDDDMRVEVAVDLDGVRHADRADRLPWRRHRPPTGGEHRLRLALGATRRGLAFRALCQSSGEADEDRVGRETPFEVIPAERGDFAPEVIPAERRADRSSQTRSQAPLSRRYPG